MIKVYLLWILQCCGIPWNELKFRIHIHETADSLQAKVFWQNVIGRQTHFYKTVLKRHKPKTNRKNTSLNYHGLLEIRVARSVDFNRKIQGWIQGIANANNHSGIV